MIIIKIRSVSHVYKLGFNGIISVTIPGEVFELNCPGGYFKICAVSKRKEKFFFLLIFISPKVVIWNLIGYQILVLF